MLRLAATPAEIITEEGRAWCNGVVVEIPSTPALAALAALVRSSLAELSGALEVASARRIVRPRTRVLRTRSAAVADVATTIVTAASPFAPTSFARLRLIRQLHATGLLSGDEVRRTERVLELAATTTVARRTSGAPSWR